MVEAFFNSGDELPASMDHETTKRCFEDMSKLIGKPKGMDIEDICIHVSKWTYRPASQTFDQWIKSEYHVDEDLSISSKVRGQGHSHYEFKGGTEIAVEVVNIESQVDVAWQSGTRSKYESTQLVPGKG